MQVRRRGRRGTKVPPAAVIVGLVAVVGLVWGGVSYANRSVAPEMVPGARNIDPPSGQAESGVRDSVPVHDARVPLFLPPLDSSDVVVRTLARAASDHPALAAWLVTDDLVRRFVRAVVDLAGGKSPTEPLDFMYPAGEFTVRGGAGATVIDPASYERYTPFVTAFVSVEPEAAADLYRELRPLMEESYREFGIDSATFEEALAMAIDNLLATPIPQGDVQVRSNATVYLYEDPALEEASQAQKQLIRMGPENAARFLTRLREIRALIL